MHDPRFDPDAADRDESAGFDPVEEAAAIRTGQVEPAQHGLRLDRALVAWVPEFSRTHLKALVQAGHVRLDGAVQSQAARKVRAGQRWAVDWVEPASASAFLPEPMALPIVYEDAHLMVLDKPAGLVMHPAAGHWGGTLLNGLLAHHAAAATLPRAGIVHRLDKDTSGLLVVGKSALATARLAAAIAAREVRREYLAVAAGRPRADAWTIEAPVGRDPGVRVRMAVVAGGRAARTDVRVLARASLAAAGGTGCLPMAAVACRLHTGRTHQIRVHLAHAGHPLAGDSLYGGPAVAGIGRQALHAWRLGFRHPVDGRALAWVAGLPGDLAPAWQALGAPAPEDCGGP